MLMSKERESEQSLPERWSAKAKTEIVLRLFRGESVDAVSHEIQVPVHEIETGAPALLLAGTPRGLGAVGVTPAAWRRHLAQPNNR